MRASSLREEQSDESASTWNHVHASASTKPTNHVHASASRITHEYGMLHLDETDESRLENHV